jgi:hypothetical protein
MSVILSLLQVITTGLSSLATSFRYTSEYKLVQKKKYIRLFRHDHISYNPFTRLIPYHHYRNELWFASRFRDL